jgi:G:T-mismatch repair DNA endonuclease (very short patch repair protein)
MGDPAPVSERPRRLPGVFIGSHAIADGALTKTQLRTRSYRRLVQGVYADPALEFDHRLRCRGVALLLPPGFAVGGLSAAGWYGAPFAGPLDPVTVIGPPDSEWKGPRGVRVHRNQVALDVVVDQDGVPVTSAMRTAWDTAALETTGTAVAVLDAMVRCGTVSVPELESLLGSKSRTWGITKVRRAVGLVDARAESPPESRVRVALVMAGLAPVPQYEVRSTGEILGRVDLAFPDARLAIEYEGAYHFEDDQIVRDDARYARLRAAGWTVIRLSSADLRDLVAVVARVRTALMAISAV